MRRGDYLDRWSELHGYEPRKSGLVAGWLTVSFVLARPVASARVSAHALTAAGVVLAAFAAVSAASGTRWLWLAALLVVLNGLLDSLDGAVAVLRHRVSRFGAALDAAADRVSDLLFVAALWLAGADAAVSIVGAMLMLSHEYVRARMRSRGRRDVGVVTVSERPTRVIVTAMFLLAAGVSGDPTWSRLGAWAWVGLGAIGLAQLLLVATQPEPGAKSRRGHARPMSPATIAADMPTSGRPPPGCAEPPTRKRPGTEERLAGRRKAPDLPLEELP